MGEVTIPLSQWFPSGEVELWSENLPVSAVAAVQKTKK